MKEIEKITEEFEGKYNSFLHNESLARWIKEKLTTIYNKGKEDRDKEVIAMVKTTKDPYMLPITEKRFIYDLDNLK